MFFCTSSKRKQKKKIRRILDDAELGEETKRKIAIEKVSYAKFLLFKSNWFLVLSFALCSNFVGTSRALKVNAVFCQI